MAISDTTKSVLIGVLILITLVTLITSVSINASTKDPVKKNNALISETTIFGFVIIALALIVYLSGGGGASSATVASTIPTIASVIPRHIDTSTTIMSILLVVGTLTAFICTSLDLKNSYSAEEKQNVFAAEGIIFCIVIIGIGFTASTVFGDDIQSKEMYIMMAVHAAVALSVVSLSASIMSKLSVANTIGNKPAAPQSA